MKCLSTAYSLPRRGRLLVRSRTRSNSPARRARRWHCADFSAGLQPRADEARAGAFPLVPGQYPGWGQPYRADAQSAVVDLDGREQHVSDHAAGRFVDGHQSDTGAAPAA